MKPAPFVHHAPATVDEAVDVLARVGADGKVLAGGQSLIPLLSMRLASPGHLVDINGVDGLDDIEVTTSEVVVGALVRHARLERDEGVSPVLPLLGQALHHVAHPAIRNRGTTVGSVVHADPAAEVPAVLALTGGSVDVTGPRGTRRVAADELFVGPLETSLSPDELVTAAHFPILPPGTRTAFLEVARRRGDYALAGVGVAVTVQDGRVSRARASFVSVTPVPDVLDLTDAVAGIDADDDDWAPVADAVREHVTPEDDIHATAEYRTALAAELTRRALSAATREEQR